MRKIIVTTWITLDGMIAGPSGEMEFVERTFNDEMSQYEDALVDSADTLLLGRVTYESFAGSWPMVPDNPDVSEAEKAYARKLNAIQKVVVSGTLDAAGWHNSTLLSDLTAENILQLKNQPGKNIVVYGSASVVQQLTNLRLIDEYQLLVHPFILGAGKPLFSNIKKAASLKLIQSKPFKSGVVALYYAPAGDKAAGPAQGSS